MDSTVIFIKMGVHLGYVIILPQIEFEKPQQFCRKVL